MIPDANIQKRITYLERRIDELEFALTTFRNKERVTTPLSSRLWLCTLNEAIGDTTAGEAAADLLKLDGSDTELDVTVTDLVLKSQVDEAMLCLEQLDLSGKRYFALLQMFELVGGCLDEDHPGRGTAFDMHLGTWNPSTDSWDYAAGTVTAIDWRYGVPYPDAGATGLFTKRLSDTYGVIYETVALDCDTPGECGS